MELLIRYLTSFRNTVARACLVRDGQYLFSVTSIHLHDQFEDEVNISELQSDPFPLHFNAYLRLLFVIYTFHALQKIN